MRNLNLLLPVSLGVLALAGCGTPGAPQPPSLHLPKPVEDLQAVRKGDSVHLSWTAPNETTDGEGIKSEGKIQVCRALQTPGAASCRAKAGELPLPSSEHGADRRQSFVDDLSAILKSGTAPDFFTYNVIAENNRGRSAGPSNPVAVFNAPSVLPVTELRAEVRPDAVVLSWRLPAAPVSKQLRIENSLRVLRQDAKQAEVMLGQGAWPATEYRDTTFLWEAPYTYTVVGVTKVLSRDGSKTLAEFSGEPSQPVTITPHDLFPPRAPASVQAVFSNGSIDLTWRPNTESDLAGYNVYRGAQKLNQAPIVPSAFRDEALQGVAPGSELVYSVSAVDQRGNESERSQPARETVPRP